MCNSPPPNPPAHSPQVIESHHTFLDRQVLLLRCCLEPLNAADQLRLARAGLRGSALGRPDVACNPQVPGWLQKWAALTLEFVELERQLLPGVRRRCCGVSLLFTFEPSMLMGHWGTMSSVA